MACFQGQLMLFVNGYTLCVHFSITGKLNYLTMWPMNLMLRKRNSIKFLPSMDFTLLLQSLKRQQFIANVILGFKYLHHKATLVIT